MRFHSKSIKIREIVGKVYNFFFVYFYEYDPTVRLLIWISVRKLYTFGFLEIPEFEKNGMILKTYKMIQLGMENAGKYNRCNFFEPDRVESLV